MKFRGLTVVALVASQSAFSQVIWYPQATIENDSEPDYTYGSRVALGDDELIVTVWSLGKLLYYTRDEAGWRLAQTVETDVEQLGDVRFVEGELAVTGGSSFLYGIEFYARTLNGWESTQRIELNPPFTQGTPQSLVLASHEQFRFVGDRSLDLGTRAGAVYVLERLASSWNFEIRLNSTGRSLGLGSSVAGASGWVITYSSVGLFGDDAGSLVEFEETNGEWMMVDEWSDGDPLDHFGESIAFVDPYLIVGVPDDIVGFDEVGTVQTYQQTPTGWVHHQTILPPDMEFAGRFGSRVVVSGDTLAVLQSGNPANPASVADVYIYERDETGVWMLNSAFEFPASGGISLALESGMLAVAATTEVAPGSGRRGVVHLFQSGTDCDLDGVVDSIAITQGLVEDCDMNGIPDACDFSAGTLADCDANGLADECEITQGAADCDENGILDSCDIAAGASDANANGVPDECECLADITGDGFIGLDDLGIVLSQYGSASGGSGDLDADGDVDLSDLGLVLAHFGETCN